MGWSSRHGIADVPIWQVPVLNILWDSWNTHNLRLLSQGINMHAILIEKTEMCTLIKELRDKIQHHKIDIASLGKFLFKANLSSTSKGPIHPTISEGSAALADEILAFIQQKVKDSNKTQQDKIHYLEQQLAEAHKSSSPDPNRKRSAPPSVPLSPTKRQKTDNLQDPTAEDTLVCSSNIRPLANDAPKSGHSTTVRTWIKSIQSHMLPVDAKKMDNYIEAVVQTWTKTEKTKRPNAKDLAAQWGLPVVQAMDFNDPTLIKVSAAAAWQVCYKTA